MLIIAVGLTGLIFGVVIGMLIGAATTYDALTLVQSDSSEHGDRPL